MDITHDRNHQQKNSSGPLSFLAFVLLPIIAFSLGWTAAETKSNKEITEIIVTNPENPDQENNSPVDISLMQDAIRIIQQKYVDPEKIDAEKMREGIVRGLVWSLDDPYSEFMSSAQSEEFEDELDGNLEGIGAELTVKEGRIVVVSPLRDSPAEAGGLLPGDIIIEVDGEVAPGNEFLDVIKRIRGEKGTEVTLSIFRPSTIEEKEIIIIRDQIRVETVVATITDNILILEVSQFGSNTENEFKTALRDGLLQNPKGIILDLRFNSGGFLDTAVEMVSAFQDDGLVVIQKGRPPEVTAIPVTGKVITDLPMVILQNGGSASASEIVAGALQDNKRALVFGEQSFGKGTVQELVRLQGGAHLRLTIAKWLTPNRRDIGKVGIEPDIIIERTTEDYENDNDPQLSAALQYLLGASQEEIRTEYSVEPEPLSPLPTEE